MDEAVRLDDGDRRKLDTYRSLFLQDALDFPGTNCIWLSKRDDFQEWPEYQSLFGAPHDNAGENVDLYIDYMGGLGPPFSTDQFSGERTAAENAWKRFSLHGGMAGEWLVERMLQDDSEFQVPSLDYSYCWLLSLVKPPRYHTCDRCLVSLELTADEVRQLAAEKNSPRLTSLADRWEANRPQTYFWIVRDIFVASVESCDWLLSEGTPAKADHMEHENAVSDTAGEVTWTDAAERLKRLKSQGEQWKSYGDYAAKFTCSSSTVHTAVERTAELHSWAGYSPRDDAKPRRGGSIGIALEDSPQVTEPDPASAIPLEEPDIERTLKRLRAEAKTPEQRAEIEKFASDPENRRGLAEAYANTFDLDQHARGEV